jgi:hypothetical protein
LRLGLVPRSETATNQRRLDRRGAGIFVFSSSRGGSALVIELGKLHPELRDGRIDAIEERQLDSQWVAQQVGRPVIKAIALPVPGDSRDGRATVLRLVDQLGFDSVDVGDLDESGRHATGAPACR